LLSYRWIETLAGAFNPLEDEFVPEAVAFWREVEAVFFEEVGGGWLAGFEHGGGGVEVVETLALLAEFLDGEVCLIHLGPEVPAFGAGFDGEEDDVGLGESGVDFFGEVLEIVDDDFGGLAFADVVIARVEEDGLGLIGEDDALGEVEGIFEFGAAEATVDRDEIGEGFLEVPEADAGGADEEVGLFRWGRFFVSGFKFGDVFLPLGRGG